MNLNFSHRVVHFMGDAPANAAPNEAPKNHLEGDFGHVLCNLSDEFSDTESRGDMCLLYALNIALAAGAIARLTAAGRTPEPVCGVDINCPTGETGRSVVETEAAGNVGPAKGADPEAVFRRLNGACVEVRTSAGSYTGTLGLPHYADTLSDKLSLLRDGPCVAFLDTDGFALDAFRERQAPVHAVCVIDVKTRNLTIGPKWIIRDSIPLKGPHPTERFLRAVGFGEQGISAKRFFRPLVTWDSHNA